VVVPVVYNINQNQTSLASLQKELNNPALHAVQQHLNRWNSNTLPVPGIPHLYEIMYWKIMTFPRDEE
jgi:hypothetical protein